MQLKIRGLLIFVVACVVFENSTLTGIVSKPDTHTKKHARMGSQDLHESMQAVKTFLVGGGLLMLYVVANNLVLDIADPTYFTSLETHKVPPLVSKLQTPNRFAHATAWALDCTWMWALLFGSILASSAHMSSLPEVSHLLLIKRYTKYLAAAAAVTGITGLIGGSELAMNCTYSSLILVSSLLCMTTLIERIKEEREHSKKDTKLS